MLSDAYQPIQRPYISRQHVLITNTLRLAWVVIVLSGELGAFFWSLSGCNWPELNLGKVSLLFWTSFPPLSNRYMGVAESGTEFYTFACASCG